MSPDQQRQTTLGRLRSWPLRAWRTRQLPFYVAPFLFVISFGASILTNKSGISVFNTLQLLSTVYSNSVVLIFLALGADLVLASGAVDISTPGLAAFGAVVFVDIIQLTASYPLIGFFVALIATVVIGISSGLFLGFLVVRFGASPLIASWAMGVVWFNAAMYLSIWSGGDASGVLTPLLFDVSLWSPFGHGPLISLGGLFLFFTVIETTRLPHMAAAVGANEKSAKYLGLQVNAIRVWCFIVSGILAVAAGIISVSLNMGKADVGSFRGIELLAIAIAVLGGTVMSGGYLRLWSVFLAGLCWQTIAGLATHFNIQITESVPEGHEWVFAILVLAVAFLVSATSGKDMIRVYIKK